MINKLGGIIPLKNIQQNKTNNIERVSFQQQPDCFIKSQPQVAFKGSDNNKDKYLNKAKALISANKVINKDKSTVRQKAQRLKQTVNESGFIDAAVSTVLIVGLPTLYAVGLTHAYNEMGDDYLRMAPTLSGHRYSPTVTVDKDNGQVHSDDLNVHVDTQKGIISMPDKGIDIRPERFTHADFKNGVFENEDKGIFIDLKNHKYIDPEMGINMDLDKGIAQSVNSDNVVTTFDKTAIGDLLQMSQDNSETNALDYIANEHSEETFVMDESGDVYVGEDLPTDDISPVDNVTPDMNVFSDFIDHSDDGFYDGFGFWG